jgi:hypothetical protein
MPPFKPDTDSFNRLLASLGVLLVALGCIGPLFIYKETAALRIGQRELDGLTPTAQHVIRNRQNRMNEIDGATPIVAALTVLGGVLLLFVGARGMKALQHLEFRTASALVAEAEAKIAPQSPAETEQQVREEAELVEAVDRAVADRPGSDTAHQAVEPDQAAIRDPVSRSAQLHRRYRETEERVLSTLANKQSSKYTFRQHVAITSGTRDFSKILLDGVFTSRKPADPDVIVEVKIAASGTVIKLGADQLLAAITRYEATTGRHAQGWLIVVIDQTRERRRREREAQALLGDRATATVLSSAEIPALELMAIPG